MRQTFMSKAEVPARWVVCHSGLLLLAFPWRSLYTGWDALIGFDIKPKRGSDQLNSGKSGMRHIDDAGSRKWRIAAIFSGNRLTRLC